MKKNYIIIILLSVIVVFQLILLVIFIPQANNNNPPQELDEETTEDITSLLAENISIELGNGLRNNTNVSYYGKITNSNDVAIESVRGTILFYNDQNQLIHTVSFQDNTLIPKNFTRTQAFFITMPRTYEYYSYFDVVFQEIIPA